MAVSTTIKKGASTYTVWTSGGIVKNALLYTTSALTTLWNANYGRFTFGAGNLEYCDINQRSTVTERFYSFAGFGGGDTLYTKVPQELPGIIGQILYNDLLYYGNPLKPVTANGNWSSANGLVLLETANSNGTIIALKEAPFISFNSFTSSASAVQSDRNGKVGVKLNVLVGAGFGGTPPFSVITGSGIIYSELSSGPILQFDDWRVSGTRTARISDSFTAVSFFNIPTIQYISNASYYPYVFGSNGSIVITPNIPAADYPVQPKYRIVDIESGDPISYQWSVTPSFTGIPLKDVYLEVQDQYGTWFQTTLEYTAAPPPEPPVVVPVTATFVRFEPTLSTNQNDRNNNVASVFNVTGGTSPYSVTTGAGSTVTNIGNGIEIKFDDARNNSTRSTKFFDTLNAYVYATNPTLQYIANPDYYSNYTFGVDGTLTITPTIPNNATYTVTPQYQIVDIEANYPIKTWQTSPVFTGIPLKNVYLQVKDQYGSFLQTTMNFSTSALTVNWNFINQSIASAQNTRNYKANYNYYISGGIPPYNVQTYSETFTLGNGPLVNFDFARKSDYRSATFRDSGGNSSVMNIYTAKYTADLTYYDNYTFTVANGLVVTPNIPTAEIYNTITVEYRLQDIESGMYLTAWQTTPTFPLAPLKNVYMEIRDVLGSYVKKTMIYTPEQVIVPITEDNNLLFTNDPMVVIYNSDLKYSQNMKYTFTMFDKDGSTLLKTSVYPDIENNFYGIYNMNMLYNNFTTTSCNFDIDNAVVTDNIYKYYYNISDNPNNVGVDSSTKYCLKGATVYGESFNMGDYTGEPSVNHKFLTKWNGNRLLRTDDYGVVNYLNGNFTDTSIYQQITHLAFVKYEAGEQNHTFINNDSWYHDDTRVNYIPLSIINTKFSNKLIAIPYGTANFETALLLGNVFDSSGIVTYNNILTETTTTRYEMHLVNKTANVFKKMSESIIVDLNKDEMCNKYEPTKFIWLDMYGNYNTFTFNGMNIKEFNLDRSTINNDYFKVDNNDVWNYSIGDRGRKTINIKKIESHEANSGWLNDDLSNNLMDLYSSTDVYVIKDKELYPVIITTNNVEQKTTKNNRLFNHTINYEMAYDINTNE